MSDETNEPPANSPAQNEQYQPPVQLGVPPIVEKPPTQSFTPGGTDFHSVAEKQKSARDRLEKLPGHPPFQMFIEEAEPNQAGINSLQYATERGIAAIGRMGENEFIDSYLAWWNAKGYWIGESPFGLAQEVP